MNELEVMNGLEKELDAYKPIELRETLDDHPIVQIARQAAAVYRKKGDEVLAAAENEKKYLYDYAERLEKDAEESAIHTNTMIKSIRAMHEDLNEAVQKYNASKPGGVDSSP